jgi:hypothetical protein
MEALYQYLIHDLFRRLLSGDDDVVNRISASPNKITLRGGDLIFTLSGLFDFALKNFARDRPNADKIDSNDYLGFRKTLYAHPTNTLLEHYGGIVEVESVNENQMLTVYRLRRIEQ